MEILPNIRPMTNGKQGRWVYVPAEKWETERDEYYSMAASAIYLRLVFRLPDKDVKFCMRYGINPRPTISNKQLPVFIEGARAGVDSGLIKFGCAVPRLGLMASPLLESSRTRDI